MKTPVKKIGLVGCGRISKRHIEAILENDSLELVTVCDENEGKAKSVGESLGVPYVTDYRELQGLDVISILTPSGFHPHHVGDIAEMTDAPYIVCEKPLSLTLREAYEMLSRIDRAGKMLLPVYQNRYNPLIEYIRHLIHDGHLGTIHQFACNIFWNRNDEYFAIDWHGTRELDGGVLYTQASHYVDMLHFLFGDVEETKGIGGNLRGLEVFDSISAVCKFKSGVVGTLNATVSTYKQNYITEFTVIGSEGTVRLSGTNLNTIDFWDVDGWKKPDLDFKQDHIYGKGHNTMYQYIVDERWDMFPTHDDVLSGIGLMEKLSY